MSDKIGDEVQMNYCFVCEEVFEDKEEGRCPNCWETEDTGYATLKIISLEKEL